MAVYDLEEQEKIDDLKAWWNRWGNTIAVAVIAACVVIGGVQGWRWWTGQQAEEASVLYQAVAQAARAERSGRRRSDAMAQLADRFSGTGYAPRAALVLRQDAVRRRRQGRREGAARMGRSTAPTRTS